MSQIAKRGADAAIEAGGGVATTVSTALLTAAAVALKQPELAFLAVPGGALAGAMTGQGLDLVRQTLGDRHQRVNQFAETAAKQAGMPVEELLEEVANTTDQRVRELLAQAVEAAAESPDEWKVNTLARAFVRGAQDDTKIDEMLFLVPLVRELSVPHVRLLAAIKADPAQANSEKIGGAQPTLRPVMMPVIRDLERREFITTSRTAVTNVGVIASYNFSITDLGIYVAELLMVVGEDLLARQT